MGEQFEKFQKNAPQSLEDDIQYHSVLNAIGGQLYVDREDLNKQLLEAAENVELETVKNLLKQGADANASDNFGSTPLLRAVVGGAGYNDHSCKEIVQLLIENGADVNAASEDGITALHMAVSVDDTEIVKVLLKNEANVNAKTADGRSAIDLTKDENIKLILKQQAIKQTNIQFLEAISQGKWEEAEELMKRGVYIADRRHLSTPLHWVVAWGDREAVEKLIEEGVDINAKNKKGQTAIAFAKDEGIKRILKQVKALDAARRGDWDEVESLMNNDSLDLNSKDKYGNTLLHYAVKQGKKKEIELLLDEGVEVNARNNQGLTAMDAIIEKSNLDFDKLHHYPEEVYLQAAVKDHMIMNELIEKGANITNIDTGGIKDKVIRTDIEKQKAGAKATGTQENLEEQLRTAGNALSVYTEGIEDVISNERTQKETIVGKLRNLMRRGR